LWGGAAGGEQSKSVEKGSLWYKEFHHKT
jgi:hypothetical protein